MKLDWITLGVSDLEKSLSFYRDLLNLEISARFGDENQRIVFLGEAGGTKIELIFKPNAKVENPGNGVSIGLEADDLDGLVGLLNDKGFKTTGPISPNPRLRFFFVRDPDGYTIQLVEQK
ncbi:MAG: VOC family protein [Planctomycetota bacterium]|jgi:lactoylglutathione lyase|nr:VOC family protein [Planctomycetota bacterium]